MHMWINESGKLLRHKIVRGLMLSRARLTYEQVQEAVDGRPDEIIAPLMNDADQAALYRVENFRRRAHQTWRLDLDLPERKIVVNDAGEMTGAAVRERLDSHKVIEEFMILPMGRR